MGARKFQYLFSKTGGSSSPQSNSRNKEDKIKEKAMIESLREAINKKLKDPTVAKKAAQIISELIK